MIKTGRFENKTARKKNAAKWFIVEKVSHSSKLLILEREKRVDFKIRKKTVNRKTGRLENKKASDNITDRKKAAKKRPMT